MNYNEFKQLAENKTTEEILNLIRKNIENFEIKQVYFNTTAIFTQDNVKIATQGNENDAQAEMRLNAEAYKLSKEYAKAQEEVKNIKAANFIGKKIWGKEIINATKNDNKIEIELKNGATYSFKNINKLNNLVK